jgi:hypothetical protein
MSQLSTYQRQSNKGILPDICSLSRFVHQIEDDRMSYEPIEYLLSPISRDN